MKTKNRMLAVIPARGGSKGLPGKNIRPLAGLPLIAHSIKLAKICPQVSRLIVSTDSKKIAAVARRYGAEIPFIRPAELARDDTPTWPVLRHALRMVEDEEENKYEYLLLLDATSPGRLPEDIEGALKKLRSRPDAVGIIGVSRPEFNPIWHCVIEENGWMKDLLDAARKYNRRQDIPTVYRINASLYIWRTDFVRRACAWRDAPQLIYEIPEERAIHIDDLHGFKVAEILIRHGLIKLPWLKRKTT